MAVTVKIHPGKRKANPMFHGKTAEKPRLTRTFKYITTERVSRKNN